MNRIIISAIFFLTISFVSCHLIFAQNSLQPDKRQALLIEKINIQSQVDLSEKYLKELEIGLIDNLEHMQLNYEQWVRKNGVDNVAESLLNDIRDKKERGELEIAQNKEKIVIFI
jgi:hypothetical protein